MGRFEVVLKSFEVLWSTGSFRGRFEVALQWHGHFEAALRPVFWGGAPLAKEIVQRNDLWIGAGGGLRELGSFQSRFLEPRRGGSFLFLVEVFQAGRLRPLTPIVPFGLLM